MTHAVTAIGSIAEDIEPLMSTITPTVRVGSSVCVRLVRRHGSTCVMMPFDLNAAPCTIARVRNRPGGTIDLISVSSRSRYLAFSSICATLTAAARSSPRGARFSTRRLFVSEEDSGPVPLLNTLSAASLCSFCCFATPLRLRTSLSHSSCVC